MRFGPLAGGKDPNTEAYVQVTRQKCKFLTQWCPRDMFFGRDSVLNAKYALNTHTICEQQVDFAWHSNIEQNAMKSLMRKQLSYRDLKKRAMYLPWDSISAKILKRICERTSNALRWLLIYEFGIQTNNLSFKFT